MSTNTSSRFEPADHVPLVTDATLEEIATRSEADPRAVLRAVVGLPVRGRAGLRVVAGLASYAADFAAA